MMPRGFYPVLLILAFASPASVVALGLGDIHVDSALNEPLSAQIDIVGASLDDLADLRAVIANLDTFQHYGAERPSYLNSSTFKIGRDSQGRPVLNVRSRESFTDPLVSFLVDLKWRNSELVREYSLLLDPAGMLAARREAASTAAASAALATPSSVASPTSTSSATIPAIVAAPSRSIATPHAVDSGSLHRITSRDTLRAIVRHAGARSETQVQRMMIATFRANPGAFEGNINRLHRGVVLSLPTSADADAISSTEAKQEVDRQMTAWRGSAHSIARRTMTIQVDASTHSTKVSTLTAAVAAPAAVTQTDAALTNRLHSLEQQLVDLHQQMINESANIQELKTAGSHSAAVPPAVEAAPTATMRTPAPMSTNTLLAFGALLLGAILAVYGYLRSRLRHGPALRSEAPTVTVPLAPISAMAESVKPAAAMLVPKAATAPPLRSAAPEAAPPRAPLIAAQDPGQGMTIEVDTEALERSYLESLGFNTTPGKTTAATGEFAFAETAQDAADVTVELAAPLGKPASVSSEIEMSDLFDTEIDTTGVNTAVIKIDATTTLVPVGPEAGPTSSIDPAHSATTELDFNLSDLDATAQHVQMPSALNDHVEVSEGRTNIVDVLKMAIDRDPHRRDLRLKLVETYYNAATGNRRAFMDVVRKLAREREYLSAEEWAKVVRMGRDLAPDDMMFADDLLKDADDVAA